MRKQSGNFLLQALLALTLVFAFLPFLAGKLSSRDMTNKLYSAKEIIDTAQIAARIYLTENIDSLAYKTYIYSDAGDSPNFFTTLEPYGLPLGFKAKTIFNQNIDFVIDKQYIAGQPMVDAYLKVDQGNMTKYQMSELTRMLGFYAVKEQDYIKVYVPTTEQESEFQDIVLRSEPANAIGFKDSLDMNGNDIVNVKEMGKDYLLTANVDEDGIGGFTNLTFKEPVTIDKLSVSNSVTFRGKLKTSGKISAFNIIDGGNIGGDGSVVNNILTAGTNVGTLLINNAVLYAKLWDVGGEVNAPYAIFKIENLSLSNVDVKFYEAACSGERGRANCGVSVDTLRASKIRYTDSAGKQTDVGVDPGDVFQFDDVIINSIAWKNIALIRHRYGYGSGTSGVVSCDSVISGTFQSDNHLSLDEHSLIGLIACKYIYLERLERRIKRYICVKKNACQ